MTNNQNRYIYHYCAFLAGERGVATTGIAKFPYRITDSQDLDKLKELISSEQGIEVSAISSLSYLGRETDQ